MSSQPIFPELAMLKLLPRSCHRLSLPCLPGYRHLSSLPHPCPPLGLTLALLKPDLVLHPPNLSTVQRMIVDNSFHIVRSKRLQMTPQLAGQFYGEHEGKFFHHRLVTFMTSGPSQVLILAKQNAIADWRELMGPTKVFKSRYSHPLTIRGQFGLTDTRNCCHGSDSPETARREIGFFFPEFSVENFLATEEFSFRAGQLAMDWQQFLHIKTPL